MCIVRHDNATKQDRHDARQLQALSKEVWAKGKQEPDGKLQRVHLA